MKTVKPIEVIKNYISCCVSVGNCELFNVSIFSRAQYCDVCTIGCFAKSTFQQKIKGIPSRIPPGCIFRSKSFFSWDKSKRSQHLVKNEGLLHCIFSLSHHLARPRVVRVEIYNVKVLHFSLSAGTF